MKNLIKRSCLLGVCLLAFSACGQKDKTEFVIQKIPEISMDGTPLERLEQAFKIAQSTTGDGDPAMWKMSDKDTTIYLFGTFHLLPEDVGWKTAGFDQAFNAADTLYMEVDTTSPEAMQKMQSVMLKAAMFSNGESLATTLTEDDYATVLSATQKVGLPDGAMDSAKPWFASLQLMVMQMMKEGYNPNLGVESVITEAAKETEMKFGYFEFAEDQINVLSGASLEEQIEGLVFMSETLDKTAEMTNLLMEEWADGDMVGLGVLMSNPAMFGSEKAYDAMIVDRNKNWVPQIEAILDDPGTKFVAVGAGHLTGPDSVITMLESKGHKIEVVQ